MWFAKPTTLGTFAYLKKALIAELFYSLPELMVYLQTYGDMRGVKKKGKGDQELRICQ